MRKLSGWVAVALVALIGAFLVWPDSFMAFRMSLEVLVERQLSEEFGTLRQLRSGELKIGASSAKSGKSPSVEVSRDPVSFAPPKRAKSPEIAVPVKPINPRRVEPAPARLVPEDAAADAGTLNNTTPEAALGAILKHEIRENQAKEETFWTEDRIQEALKNGAPKSTGGPCLVLCDNNDTVTEINMPKPPSESYNKP